MFKKFLFWCSIVLALAVITPVTSLIVPAVFAQATYYITPSLARWGGMTVRGGTNPFIPIPAYLNWTRITTNTTTVVKATPGFIAGVVINTKGASSNTLTIYGTNNATSYNRIATIDTSVSDTPRYYGTIGQDGITIVTATGTACDCTVLWK